MVRIGGLASGMDIDSLVNDLMKAERMPLDKLKQKKQVLEWQRDDYRSMNTLLLDFRTQLTQMKLTTQYRARTVTSSDESRITATATSAASQASYSISKVTKLASAENWVTNGVGSVDSSKSLASQTSNFTAGLTWQKGAVGSSSLVGNGSTTGLKLDLAASDGETIKTDELAKMSVKVNGVAYEVVSSTSFTVGKNQVHIDANGSLTFSNTVAAGATVKVNYITNHKVQTGSLADGAKSFQLNKKNIIADDFRLTVGGTDYSITSVDPATNVGQLSNGFGSINLTTGEITFNAAQAADTEIKAVYQQEYADFSISTYTSASGNESVKESFLVESSESLNSVINRVNSSKAGVSMFFDSATGKISMMRTETGDFHDDPNTLERDYDISVTGDFASVTLGFSSAAKTHGENAAFVINGLSTTRHSNTFDLNGVNITLKKEFDDGTSATLSINNDGNKVFENIKSFVEKYNELIGKINGKVSEEKYRSYTPLTDEQREQLGDKQQELWEEKAKSGLLRRDSILTGALTSMRMKMYQPVSNNDINPLYNQLASIGITTTSNYLEGGKLEINEAKLKEAINNNPDAVEALFRGGSESAAESEKGIIHRLYDSVNETMDKLKEKAGNSFSTNQQFTLGRTLSDLNSRIDRFEERMIQVEDRYWRQFTAMEKAIQRSNEQSMFLMNQFGGM
ncbi:flagellar filament capping protein FliD [Cytobacillus firmus]|uniref:flagellar filament capping protein FliD n=1 Tax=Cytobacillus firmus TaxID=1399 RepID=UPI0018CCEC37|nr:flagellar filament capping protein FliD [Cytobacillus firmus]MBG9586616.1 flagellar hook protein [Cytobacillus firmus]